MITFSRGTTSIPHGSVGAPSVFFLGSPTTGWYRPAVNQWAFSSEGVQGLLLDSNATGFGVIVTSNGFNYTDVDGLQRNAMLIMGSQGVTLPSFSFVSGAGAGNNDGIIFSDGNQNGSVAIRAIARTAGGSVDLSIDASGPLGFVRLNTIGFSGGAGTVIFGFEGGTAAHIMDGASFRIRTGSFEVTRGLATLGDSGSFTGRLDFDGATSGTVRLTVAAAAGTWTFTLPTNDGDANDVLITNGAGVSSWTAPGALAVRWSSLTAPTAALALTMPATNETTFTVASTTQRGFTWTSSTITSGGLISLALTGASAVATAASNGALITLTSTTTGFTGVTQRLMGIFSSGANANASAVVQGIAISVTNTGVTNTNTALALTASGGATSNYALHVTAGTLRMPNAVFIVGRNAADAADINMININAADLVAFGANVAAFTLAGAITGSGSPTIGTVGAITSNAVLTVSAGGITVTGASTITGTLGGITTLTATTLAGTLSTVAQPNVTSLGILTGLTVSGTASFTNASPFSVTNAQVLTVSTTAQTIGAATLTIPNFAGVADTFAFITLAQTLSNKTLAAPAFSGVYSFGGTPSFGAVMAGASTFSGAITLSALLTANLGITSTGAIVNLNASSNFATNINTGTSTGAVSIGNALAGAVNITTGAASTFAAAANTAAAWRLTDGTNAYYVVDTRTGVTGVLAHALGVTNPSFASAAGSAFSLASLNAYSLTLTGGILVTALAGLSLTINAPTVTSGVATTVTTASAVIINGPIPAGLGPVTFTNSFALDLPTFATNGTASAGLRVAAPTGAVTNSSILLTGTMRSSVAGAGDAFLPTADNAGQIGNATFRWQLIRGVAVTSGDFKFENGYYMTEAERLGLAPGIALCRPDGSLITVFR